MDEKKTGSLESAAKLDSSRRNARGQLEDKKMSRRRRRRRNINIIRKKKKKKNKTKKKKKRAT